MCKIIFIGNYKGGVGKTTTTINLAQHFSELENKILTIDLDPQSSLSEIQVNNFHSKKTLKDLPDENTLNYIYELSILKLKKYPGLQLDFPNTIIQKHTDYYHYIPSSLFYNSGKGLDALAIKMEDNIAYLAILKSFIDTVKEQYDFILIDCPPSSNLITQSAFLMSDYYLIPTVLDEISTNGVIHYIHTVNNTYKKYCVNGEDAVLAKHYFGNCPKLIGIFYNLLRGQVNYGVADGSFRGALEREAQKTQQGARYDVNTFKDIYVFPYNINNYIDIARSTGQGIMSKEKTDFAEFSKAVIERIDELEKQNNDNKATD